MILVDFSNITFAALHADLKGDSIPNEDYFRHLVLNTLRAYNVKFRHEYGEIILCYDSKSWREKLFPEYKWVRKNGRDESQIDWDEIMRMFKSMQDDISDFFPYRTIQVDTAEADDLIAVLSKESNEKTLIISNDKDLVALTNKTNVFMYRQYSKEMFSVKNPIRFEFDLIVSGDKVDGIPSIKCSSDFFKTQYLEKEKTGSAKRAPNITQKFKDELWQARSENKLKEKLDELGLTENFKRNWKLIGIHNQPKELKQEILTCYKKMQAHKLNPEMKMVTYLQQHRCYLLARHLTDFKPIKLNELYGEF